MSKIWLPLPRAMKTGTPPTEFHARTGLLTPPGILLWARWKFFADRCISSVSVANIAPQRCQEICAVRKRFFFLFFSCKEIWKGLLKIFLESLARCFRIHFACKHDKMPYSRCRRKTRACVANNKTFLSFYLMIVERVFLSKLGQTSMAQSYPHLWITLCVTPGLVFGNLSIG